MMSLCCIVSLRMVHVLAPRWLGDCNCRGSCGCEHVQEPRGLSAASPPLAETGAPRRFRRSAGDETPDVDPELLRYLLGRILAGSADSEGVAAPRRLRRAADQDVGSDVPPEGVLGALLRVKRLETPAPQVPARRLLPP
ncbi:PREDICTED: proSAAS [Mandrillus leucophaeus]|uniref:proSAAS n=1 Tax=Mandrillus leucophaeus TaxID=9568 RepID=UPI0005F471E5|nr:PREDICTED: proSAAS [Mandrillus leucophaeus]